MPKDVKITCDSCGENITSTKKTPCFRLHLSAEVLPHTSDSISAVLVWPPIDQDCYFCGLACLKEWTNQL